MALVKVVLMSVLIVYNLTILLESPFLLLKSSALLLSLLNNLTLFNIVALVLIKKLAFSLRMAGLFTHYRIAILLFELC
jgi:hypothetical protein